jgi:hypothetical protein
MNLEKHRTKLIAARDEMSRTIAAIDTVLAYVGISDKKRTGRPPGVKNAIKKGDVKTGVKKSTLTKPFRPKKLPKKPKMVKRIRHMTPEGEAKRRAGYFAYVERMQAKRKGQSAVA